MVWARNKWHNQKLNEKKFKKKTKIIKCYYTMLSTDLKKQQQHKTKG